MINVFKQEQLKKSDSDKIYRQGQKIRTLNLKNMGLENKVKRLSDEVERLQSLLRSRAVEINGSSDKDVVTAAVADLLCTDVPTLLLKRRHNSVVLNRQSWQHALRTLTDMSLQEIGMFTGGYDHTTIMSSIRAVDDRMDTNSRYRIKMESFYKKMTK